MSKGFTLIELLITVAIVSILMGIGLPSFQSIIASNRITSGANAMVSALQLAKIEALKQHKDVVVAKRTSWNGGWTVYVDTNSGSPIASFDALNSTITVTSSYANSVSYSPNGRTNTGGNFLFCSATEFRKVVIAATGRIRVETPASCS
jgi:type IV fimbrial biogenesis protein FimT